MSPLSLLISVMFEELKKPTAQKERLKSKAFATIMTNFGGLNVELHGDRAPKTVYNFIQLAQQGYYNGVSFHRLIPGFMVGVILIRLTPDPRRRPNGHRLGREELLGRAVQRRAPGEGRIQARRTRCAVHGQLGPKNEHIPVLHHIPRDVTSER